ncbi:hypothetical protein DPMN_029312 [Dreissena polymorpha]|uniref:Uncharacterized protein n=1 Tax=Dreissena polymorpha TaxID=45954 RepID=A0A9D4LYW9_DREPO|nr:hypothetical protein DPMN_029312 [Dreissena polymorpha]
MVSWVCFRKGTRWIRRDEDNFDIRIRFRRIGETAHAHSCRVVGAASLLPDEDGLPLRVRCAS